MIGINKQWCIILVFATLVLLLTAAINATNPNNNITIPNEAEGYLLMKTSPAPETVDKLKEMCTDSGGGKWKDGECKFPTYDTNSEQDKVNFEHYLADEGMWDAYEEQQEEVQEEKDKEQVQKVIDDINANAANKEDDEDEEDNDDDKEDEEDNNRDYDEDPYNDSENVEGGN